MWNICKHFDWSHLLENSAFKLSHQYDPMLRKTQIIETDHLWIKHNGLELCWKIVFSEYVDSTVSEKAYLLEVEQNMLDDGRPLHDNSSAIVWRGRRTEKFVIWSDSIINERTKYIWLCPETLLAHSSIGLGRTNINNIHDVVENNYLQTMHIRVWILHMFHGSWFNST